MGAHAAAFAQLGIETKKKALLAAFGTTFHPLSLSHELDSLFDFGNVHDFRFFFDFNHLLPSILGEEYALRVVEIE